MGGEIIITIILVNTEITIIQTILFLVWKHVFIQIIIFLTENWLEMVKRKCSNLKGYTDMYPPVLPFLQNIKKKKLKISIVNFVIVWRQKSRSKFDE